jgi:hypothetical protein
VIWSAVALGYVGAAYVTDCFLLAAIRVHRSAMLASRPVATEVVVAVQSLLWPVLLLHLAYLLLRRSIGAAR